MNSRGFDTVANGKVTIKDKTDNGDEISKKDMGQITLPEQAKCTHEEVARN